MKSKTMNTSVKSDPKTVYDFISNLENLPKWAPSTFPSIKEVNGEWLVDHKDKIKLYSRKKITLGS
jgi:hypothetical protein